LLSLFFSRDSPRPGQAAHLNEGSRPISGKRRVQLLQAPVKGGLVQFCCLRFAAREIAGAQPLLELPRLLEHPQLIWRLQRHSSDLIQCDNELCAIIFTCAHAPVCPPLGSSPAWLIENHSRMFRSATSHVLPQCNLRMNSNERPLEKACGG
jgi:hypothetical protein